MVVANHHKLLDTREGEGIGRTCQHGSRLRRATAPPGLRAIINFIWRLHALTRMENTAFKMCILRSIVK
ncbi:conserved hypothetical protein [Klebsiella variicola]|nr:conserved hypothetical protein [Klebsiella variicola]